MADQDSFERTAALQREILSELTALAPRVAGRPALRTFVEQLYDQFGAQTLSGAPDELEELAVLAQELAAINRQDSIEGALRAFFARYASSLPYTAFATLPGDPTVDDEDDDDQEHAAPPSDTPPDAPHTAP